MYFQTGSMLGNSMYKKRCFTIPSHEFHEIYKLAESVASKLFVDFHMIQ